MATLLSPVAAIADPATTAKEPGGGEVLRRSAATQPSAAEAATVPTGFRDQVVWSGLTLPTAVVFAPSGRVFIAEKSGLIKTFDNTGDITPTTAVDLRTVVDDYWDRGMLGMALDPQLGTAGHNYLYVLYTYDAAPGQTPPQWNDACPGPPNGPGPTTNGCVVQGRLSRIPVDPATGVANGPEQVLIGPHWCQQYPSHSIGHLAFGPDGALYASAGDGPSFEFVDYGQAGGTVINPNRTAAHPGQPLQRPPGQSRRPQHLPERPRRGAALPEPAPSRERAGSARRHDPAAGPGHRQRPARQSAGLQHQSQRPPDRGDGAAQPLPLHRPARHQRGVGRRRRLEHLGGDRADPVTHRTGDQLRLAMLRGRRPAVRLLGPHPVPGALRRWDESGDCSLLHLQPQRDARVRGHLPDRELIHLGHGLLHRVVLSLLAPRGAVLRRPLAQLHLGDAARHQRPARPEHDRHLHRRRRHQPAGSRRPGGRPRVGDVFFADYDSGVVRRISSTVQNRPPTAVATATSPTSGPAPLTVSFSGSGSSDPDGDTITYSWDLNGDGTYGDATGPTASYTYTTPGIYSVTLQVTDASEASSTSAPISVNVGGNTPPNPVIDSPSSTLQWSVGDTVNFSGYATDAQDGTLTGSALVWTLILHHCPSDCHTHIIGTVGMGTTGSFQAPDHSYPSYLELQLTATDSGGLSATTSVRLDPRTVVLTFATNPGGLSLTVNGASQKVSFSRTVIVGSQNSLSAPLQQQKGKQTYAFDSWSDGGRADHLIVAPSTATTYTARYRRP